MWAWSLLLDPRPVQSNTSLSNHLTTRSNTVDFSTTGKVSKLCIQHLRKREACQTTLRNCTISILEGFQAQIRKSPEHPELTPWLTLAWAGAFGPKVPSSCSDAVMIPWLLLGHDALILRKTLWMTWNVLKLGLYTISGIWTFMWFDNITKGYLTLKTGSSVKMVVFKNIKWLVLGIQHQNSLKIHLVFKVCSGHLKSWQVSRTWLL